jgi:hypothetical protein
LMENRADLLNQESVESQGRDPHAFHSLLHPSP